MKNQNIRTLPRWMFTTLAMGAIWASGIYLGIMSIEGASNALLARVIGFGLLSLLMAWGAVTKR
jgi:hypothetical protein